MSTTTKVLIGLAVAGLLYYQFVYKKKTMSTTTGASGVNGYQLVAIEEQANR